MFGGLSHIFFYKQDQAVLTNSEQETRDTMSAKLGKRDLIFLILQFLKEENLSARHKLESELGLFFDIDYFEELVINGNWDEAERYLSGFCGLKRDDEYSANIFYQIRKQKYFEALDKHDRHKALEILMNELKVFAEFNQDIFNKLSGLLKIESFRKRNPESERRNLMGVLKQILNKHPDICEKLKFPYIGNSLLGLLSPSASNQLIRFAPQFGHFFQPRKNTAIPVQNPSSLLMHNPGTESYMELLRGVMDPGTKSGTPLASMRNLGDTSTTRLCGISNTDGDVRNSENVNPRLNEVQATDRMRFRVLSLSSQVQCLSLFDPLNTYKIQRLIYTSSGLGLLQLASNGTHQLWNWLKDHTNSKAMTKYQRTLWEMAAGKQMENNLEEAMTGFCLSNNDDVLVSASGGPIQICHYCWHG